MKTNEDMINLDEATNYLWPAHETAEHLFAFLENTSNYKIIKNLDDVCSKVRFIRDEIIKALDVIPKSTNNVEDWKDLVIGLLPNRASVAMANDVEDALDKFKSVY